MYDGSSNSDDLVECPVRELSSTFRFCTKLKRANIAKVLPEATFLSCKFFCYQIFFFFYCQSYYYTIVSDFTKCLQWRKDINTDISICF